MLLRKLVVVGLVGFMSLAANVATAQDALAPVTPFVAIDGVSFIDANGEFSNDRVVLRVAQSDAPRFAYSSSSPLEPSDRADRYRRYEVSLVARGAAGFDVAVAQRGGVGFDDSGDIDRESRASELRLGRGLQAMRADQPVSPTWYLFAASEDEALIWRPGTRDAFGGSSQGFALQERVEIGDLQAGITYEANGLQASLAYVEREISVRTGARTVSQDERFAGVTLTMRR